jgi:acetyltransferase-like isoleucine patch superfamily enzyme
VRAAEAVEVAADRVRAAVCRWRGCRIGSKPRFGPRTRIDRPGCVTIGSRVQLESDVWLKVVEDGARVAIGDFTFLGRGVEIDASLEVQIGQHVLLAPGVFITDHDHGIAPGTPVALQGCSSQPVVIEDEVWLGVRVVVLPGVRIGRGTVVGAGAVVTKDLPPDSIAVGVPARVIRRRAEPRAGR